jgi:hypothetical protein
MPDTIISEGAARKADGGVGSGINHAAKRGFVLHRATAGDSEDYRGEAGFHVRVDQLVYGLSSLILWARREAVKVSNHALASGRVRDAQTFGERVGYFFARSESFLSAGFGLFISQP